MRYVFLALVVLNILYFGYQSYFSTPTDSDTVKIQQAALVNPVIATNVSNELPPMIGSKK